MTQQTIDNGTTAGDGTGESLFDSFDKVNSNFDELYNIKNNSVFSSRSAAESGNVPSDVNYIGIVDDSVILWYIRDASGTALTTGDGATWSPFGDVLPDHFEENTTPGTTNMSAAWSALATWVASSNDKRVYMKGVYFVDSPIVFTSFGVKVKSLAGISEITADHTAGPVLQFRKSFFEVDNIRISAAATRAAASFSDDANGITVGDYDWTDPTGDNGASGAYGSITGCIIEDHNGHGIYTVGSGSVYDRNQITGNKGHGIFADNGDAVGVSASNFGFPGWSSASKNKIENNGGHGFAIGNPNVTTSDTIYRWELYNNDVNGNSTDAAVRNTTHQYYIVGEQITTGSNVSNASTPGFYVAGRQHKHFNNRFVNTSGEAYEIDNISGYNSYDIIIDGFRVNSPAASLNPAVVINSGLTSDKGIRVRQGSNVNITNLVASADRGKYAEITFQDETDFTGGGLSVSGVSVSPFTAATSFEPTLDFSTTGDLSVSYESTNEGIYKQIGDMVFYQIRLDCTPTFSTASGVALIGGLPVSIDSTSDQRPYFPVLQTLRISYGGSDILSARANTGTNLRLEGSTDGGISFVTLDESNFTSGSRNIIILSGWAKTA